jgi:hypothetical protein
MSNNTLFTKAQGEAAAAQEETYKNAGLDLSGDGAFRVTNTAEGDTTYSVGGGTWSGGSEGDAKVWTPDKPSLGTSGQGDAH